MSILLKENYVRNKIENILLEEKEKINLTNEMNELLVNSEKLVNYYYFCSKESFANAKVGLGKNDSQFSEYLDNVLTNMPHKIFTLSYVDKVDHNNKNIEVSGLMIIREHSNHNLLITYYQKLDPSPGVVVYYEINIKVYFDDEKGLNMIEVLASFLDKNYNPLDLSRGNLGYKDKMSYQLSENCLMHLGAFINKMKEEDLIMSKVERPYQASKKIYKKLELTYISSKSSFVDDFHSKRIPSTLEWTYSWITRGHWRKETPGFLGKDRDGIRNQIGRTWVNEAIKNKGLPFINPLRIIKE